MKSYGVIIQIKLLTQYFHSTLFILYVALDEIFWCVHSNETLRAVVSRSGDYFPLIFENEILQVTGLVRKQCCARGTGSCIHLEMKKFEMICEPSVGKSNSNNCINMSFNAINL